MRRFRFVRPSVGTVLGVIALVVAMSGVAVALPGSNTVTTGDIKNGQVTHADIAANAVTSGNVVNSTLTGSDVANSSLTGSDVANDSLTGSDVKESTLGTVPKASAADTVATLRAIAYHRDTAAPDDPGTTLLSYGGVTLTATCSGLLLDVTAKSTSPAYMTTQSFGADEDDPSNSRTTDPMDPDGESLFSGSRTQQRGTTQIMTTSNHVVTIIWSSDTDNLALGASCLFMGTATLG